MITYYDVEMRVAELEEKADFHEKIVDYIYNYIVKDIMQEKLNDKKVEIKVLQDEVESLESDVDDLEDKILELEKDIDSITDKNDELKAKIEYYESVLKEISNNKKENE